MYNLTVVVIFSVVAKIIFVRDSPVWNNTLFQIGIEIWCSSKCRSGSYAVQVTEHQMQT